MAAFAEHCGINVGDFVNIVEASDARLWIYWSVESISRGKHDLMMLALTVVGYALPTWSEPEYWVTQQRLLPHASRCVRQLSGANVADVDENQDSYHAFHNLGVLYADQGKLIEAEKMYQRALDGKEKAWGPEHTSTLDTVNNLGNLYKNQDKLIEAEKMYQRALEGYERLRGPTHPSTKVIRRNLSNLST